MAPQPGFADTSSDDAELMRRVQASDETAFATLMQRWELPVKAVIARIVLNVAEAEELAQETFVRVWQHRDRFETGRAVKPWLLGIAINLARSRLRWWRRRPSVSLESWMETKEDAAPTGNAGAAGMETSERASAVRDAIAALPTDFREALILFEYENMSYADIAAALDTKPKIIENRIARARAKLREALKSWM